MENNPESRPLENVGQPPTAVFPSPVDNSNQPLLQAEGMGSNDVSVSFGDNPSFQDASGVAQEEVDQRFAGMPMIGCRVCGAQIPYDSNSMQHVVRCISCNEATPIRSAPSGKKFVRCPCNCLLICKVSSNRIACPRASCGRVIILQPPASNGPTVPAPAGTARVQCYYCEEVFMFNTLTSCIAPCPHCQKRSSVGPSYVRARSFGYFVAALFSLLITICTIVGTASDISSSKLFILLWVALAAVTCLFVYRFYYFVTLKISKVLGPL